MKKLLRHLYSGGLAARGGWPLLLALALSALWAAPAQAEDYGLQVCGVTVTDANKDDLSVIPGVNAGAVTYDPATKTLRLKDAAIVATGKDNCIRNESVDGLTVEVEGKCEMESGEESGVYLKAATTIAGKPGAVVPSLGIASESSCVYLYKDVDCTVRDLDIATTARWGFAGYFGTGKPLTVKNATVRAKGEGGSITYFLPVKLVGCRVLEPEGAKFEDGALMLDGGVVTDTDVLIGREYDLHVCGVTVTDANRDDLSVIPGVKGGSVTYDPYANALRLKDARLEATGTIQCVLNRSVEGLTVEVEGKCAMTAVDYPGIVMGVSTVIAGKFGAEAPSLSVVTGDYGVWAFNYASCTVRDLDLTVTGERGIKGNRTGETLTVENATVRAKGEKGSICDFKSVALEGCQLVKPEGAAFESGTLMLDGGVVTGEAVILPDAAMGIGTTAVDAPRREGAYTLSGVRLAAPLDQLPRGVYVVDGQKVVRK